MFYLADWKGTELLTFRECGGAPWGKVFGFVLFQHKKNINVSKIADDLLSYILACAKRDKPKGRVSM